MAIKGVFFDLFGTLIEVPSFESSRSDWMNSYYNYLTANHCKIPREEFVARSQNFFTRLPPKKENDGLTNYERKIKRHCESLNFSLENAQYRELAGITNHTGFKSSYLLPDAFDILDQLHKTQKTALISNFDHHPFIYDLLNRFNIRQFFETVTISDELGVKKPSPAIFQPAIKRARLESHEILYIGDSECDVMGAHAAGLTPILLDKKDGRVDPSLDVQRISHLSEILTLI